MNLLAQIRVPATSANLGPGFDSIGLALSLFNELDVYSSEQNTRLIAFDQSNMKLDEKNNLVVLAYQRAFEFMGLEPVSVEMHARNKIPFSRGLGSSSAAIVSGLIAAQVASGYAMDLNDIIKLATEIDGHPDNVLPALLGGVVICSQDDDGKVFYKKLSLPKNLIATVLVPDYPLATKEARNALPTCYNKADVVYNIGHMGLLVAAFCTNDKMLLKEAMRDRLHEPYRLPLMPGIKEARDAALEAGALAAVISGAGSTLLIISTQIIPESVLIAPLIAGGNSGQVKILDTIPQGVSCHYQEMELNLWP